MARPPRMVNTTVGVSRFQPSRRMEVTVLPNRSAWKANQPKLEKQRMAPKILEPSRPKEKRAVYEADRCRRTETRPTKPAIIKMTMAPSTLARTVSQKDSPSASRPPVARMLRPAPIHTIP